MVAVGLRRFRQSADSIPDAESEGIGMVKEATYLTSRPYIGVQATGLGYRDGMSDIEYAADGGAQDFRYEKCARPKIPLGLSNLLQIFIPIYFVH